MWHIWRAKCVMCLTRMSKRAPYVAYVCQKKRYAARYLCHVYVKKANTCVICMSNNVKCVIYMSNNWLLYVKHTWRIWRAICVMRVRQYVKKRICVIYMSKEASYMSCIRPKGRHMQHMYVKRGVIRVICMSKEASYVGQKRRHMCHMCVQKGAMCSICMSKEVSYICQKRRHMCHIHVQRGVICVICVSKCAFLDIMHV